MKNSLSIYNKKWEIYIAQCSANSHLKLTEISNICQQTAALHSAQWGMSFFDMQEHNQAWVLSSMRVELFDLPIWHQSIDCQTWIENLKEMRSIRNFEIRNKDTLVAKASSLWVVINTEKRRPESLAVPCHNLLQYPERKATTVPTGRIDLSKPAQKISQRTVLYSDLDIVGHANNVKYMEWCFDTIDRMILDTNRIKVIELNYIKEINFQDCVAIYTYTQEREIYFYIKRENTICFAMRLEID